MEANIKQPKSIPAPLVLHKTDFGSIVDNVIEELGLPLVIKKAFGTGGKNVHLCHTRQEVLDITMEITPSQFMYQEFIKESAGSDIRVLVSGNKIVGVMCRTNNNDFRSNIKLGGIGKSVPVTEEIQNITTEVCKIFGGYLLGIDLLISKEGLVVCEVNTAPGFTGISQALGYAISVDVVESLLKYWGLYGVK